MAITTNFKDFYNSLNALEKKQLPYAISLCLNNTAEIAMKAMKYKIDKDFNVTASWNRVGGKYGLKKRRATKRNPEVEIYIPKGNTWIEDHERGDTRDGLQLIPTRGFKELYPTLRTNRSIKKKAKTLLSNKSKYRIFEAPLAANYSVRAIFQRQKGKQDGKRSRRSTKTGRLLKPRKVLKRDVIPLFIIKESIKEKPALEFYETIVKVFNKNIKKEFNRAFQYAMSTAK